MSDGYDRLRRHRTTMEAFDDFMAASYEGAMIKVVVAWLAHLSTHHTSCATTGSHLPILARGDGSQVAYVGQA